MGAGRGAIRRIKSSLATKPVHVDFPTLTIEEVTHIGTFQEQDKGIRGSSLEGHGLSVSINPEDWQRIAQLGGLPWWRLTNSRTQFLSAHDLSNKQREAIKQWGLTQGLVTAERNWRLTFYDSEQEDYCSTLFTSHDEALSERKFMGEEETKLGHVAVIKGTAYLKERIGMSSDGDAFDHLLCVYVEDECPGLQGIWWDDEAGYWSAPRGVILPRCVANWSAKRLEKY